MGISKMGEYIQIEIKIPTFTYKININRKNVEYGGIKDQCHIQIKIEIQTSVRPAESSKAYIRT